MYGATALLTLSTPGFLHSMEHRSIALFRRGVAVATAGTQDDLAAAAPRSVDGMSKHLDPDQPARFSSSLFAGLAMLACFSSEHPVLGIADMADALKLGRSTTHRYATTLVTLGYLEQTMSRKYRLSSRAANVGLALLDSIAVRRAAREHLRELRVRTGYTVSLGVLDGGEVVYVDRCQGSGQGQYAIDVGIGPGTRRPVYCTAAGKALLARLPAAEQHEMIKQLRLVRRGPRTITSKSALRAELNRIAIDGGVAVEDEELLAGRRALGAGVLDDKGRTVAAVELVAPVGAFTQDALHGELRLSLSAVAGWIGSALSAQHRQPAIGGPGGR